MVSDKALTYFNDKVRAIAARLGLPATSEAVEVLRDEGTLKTAYIQFDPSVYNAETAEEVATEFVEDANVSGEGLWGYEYALGNEVEEWEGCETQYFFDVSAIDEPDFVSATLKEREEWRAETVLSPKNPKRPHENVFMPLKFAYFSDIEKGRKTVECRQYNRKWVDQLLCNKVKYVTFQRGYEKGARQMTFEVSYIDIADADGRHRYAAESVPDFADPEWILIHLGKRVV